MARTTGPEDAMPPAVAVACIERAARVRRTAHAAGGMTWRFWGDEGRPFLVLLHGDFGSWTHWLRCIAPLSRRFRVAVPDMPGYGDSDPPPEPWGPEDLARIVASGLAEVVPAPRRYCLAGFSFGGIIAGHLAALAGEQVERLVLLGPGGLGLPRGRLPPLRSMAKEMDTAEVLSVHRHNLAALMLADPANADELAVHLQVENARRARIRAGDIPASDALLRALPWVRAPISGIWGERDVMAVPVCDRERVLRRFQPNLDFRVIEGAGHWVPYEAAEAVTALLLEMLRMD